MKVHLVHLKIIKRLTVYIITHLVTNFNHFKTAMFILKKQKKRLKVLKIIYKRCKSRTESRLQKIRLVSNEQSIKGVLFIDC